MAAKLSFVESAIDDTLWTGKMILVEGGGEVWKGLVVRGQLPKYNRHLLHDVVVDTKSIFLAHCWPYLKRS